MKNPAKQFEEWLAEAEQARFVGWDFGWFTGRLVEEPPPWSYAHLAQQKMVGVQTMLDMGTGGGELLASLAPLPPHTFATEAYAPNVAVAQTRLAPLGVQVVDNTAEPENAHLPFSDHFFDLIINKHEAYYPAEVARVLRPGGLFFTQQVGSEDCLGLNQWLGLEPTYSSTWYLAQAQQEIEAAGLVVEAAGEAFSPTNFYDVAAVAHYCRIIEWQFPGFEVEKYRPVLLAIHNYIQQFSFLPLLSHRFYVVARKP